MKKFLPTITWFRDKTYEMGDYYPLREENNPYRHYLIFACLLASKAKIGTVILYHHTKHPLEGWTQHCLDYLLKKTERGWQPYVSSFDIDDDRPLEYDIDISLYIWLWLRSHREGKEEIMRQVETQLESLTS